MENIEEITGRALLAKMSENYSQVRVPERPFMTQILNQITAFFKSFFHNTTHHNNINISRNDDGILSKIALVGVGIVAVAGLAFWFFKRKTDEIEKMAKESQILMTENKKLWKENQLVHEENQYVKDRVDALEHNIWEMMELILNMKNPKNKEGQEKVELQLNILKQCFEDRLNELKRENKLLRDRSKEMNDERICSICLENKLNRSFVPCGHSICQNCETSVIERNSCPFCRAAIQGIIPRY